MAATTQPTISTTLIPTATPPPPPPIISSAPIPTALQPPPADANIPTPPAGAASVNGATFRTVMPRATELAALPGALEDLKRFTNYTAVFGVTGLPYAQVVQTFDVSIQWTTMRRQARAWDEYSMIQEGQCWAVLRSFMQRMGPLFGMAVAADPSLAAMFPNLAALFGARKAIAHKAVATRKANSAAKSKGVAPTHGLVGKRRQRAAEKAALASSESGTPGAHGPSATNNGSAPATTVAGAPVGAPSNAPGGGTRS